MAVEDTLKARGSVYGDWEEHARIAQAIKNAFRDSPNWDQLPDYIKESFEMFAQKAGRVLNGDPLHQDSYHDMIGYMQLVENKIVAKAKSVEEKVVAAEHTVVDRAEAFVDQVEKFVAKVL